MLCVLPWLPLCAQQSPPAPSSSSRQKSQPVRSLPDPGTLVDGLYRSRYFAFTYKLPYGWVDRTDRMQADSEPGRSQVLLAAFERPPEASADSINSGVVIAIESVDSYPGLKSAAQYFGPLGELTTAKGFKAAGEPYQTEVGSRTLVREDFKKELGDLAMYQSSLVVLARNYVASFTFIAGSEDEVEKLVANLHFDGSGKAPRATP